MPTSRFSVSSVFFCCFLGGGGDSFASVSTILVEATLLLFVSFVGSFDMLLGLRIASRSSCENDSNVVAKSFLA